MRSLLAFTKKEFTEQIRSGRLFILAVIFVAFGIMNPATAKMTPWLFEMMSESLAESGMSITVTEVTALDSWVQFFKNVPLVLIAFVLMQSAIFTKEYTSGTLVLSLTKGLSRYKVIIAKVSALLSLWTLGYWLSFAITYAYSAWFWDNSIAKNLVAAVTLWWLFGVFVLALVTLFSTIASSTAVVTLSVGGSVVLLTVVGAIPKVSKYLPVALMDGNSLIYGTLGVNDYTSAVIITVALSFVCFAISIPLFNKKQF
jgi:ABC-2 type transport system permease protein